MSQKIEEDLFTFFNEVGIIHQLTSTRFNRVLPAGLRVMQFSVPNHMVRLGDGKSPLSLAEAFQVTKAGMTHTLSSLAEKKMVEIKPNPKDGRGKLVYLTEKGEKNRNLAIRELAGDLQFLSERIDFEVLEKSLALLTEIRQVLDKNRGESQS